MKLIIKSIVGLIIIATLSCSSLSLDRVLKNRRARSKTKDDQGRGSWKCGLTSPRLLINGKVEATDFYFNPADLEADGTDVKNVGMMFQARDIGPELKKYIVEHDKRLYIPYRFIEGPPVYGHNKENKKISGDMKNDDGDSCSFILDLPFKNDTNGSFISEEESFKLANILTQSAGAQRGKVKLVRLKAGKALPIIVSLKGMMDGADDAKVQEEMKKLAERQKEIQDKISKLQPDLDKATAAYNEKNNAIGVKEGKLKQDRLDAANIYSEITKLSQSVSDAEGQGAPNAKEQEDLAKEVKTSEDTINLSGDELKKAAPPRKEVVDKALGLVKDLTKDNKKEIKKTFYGIAPMQARKKRLTKN